MVTLLEMHVYDIFDGVDGMTTDGENQVMLPYVVTIDYDSQAIVSIRRNWEEEDEDKKRRDWFVSYRFLPGTWILWFWSLPSHWWTW